MGVKKYFKQQFQLHKFKLEHDVISDFYVTPFQRDNWLLPLLVFRTIIFAGCVCIVISSMVLTSRFMPFEYWPIYLTHWGLIFNAIAAGLAFTVSFMAFMNGSLDTSLGLPWQIKAYWAMFNVATPIAFFITLFYWILLASVEQEFAAGNVLDVFIHAINSVLMFLLLVCSYHPLHILHFYFSIGIGIVYLIFTVIYYAAGGTDYFGNHTIYPMVDWSNPGLTLVVALMCAIGIAIFHLIAVAISEARDALSRRCTKQVTAYNIDEAYY